jgi:hypothetical protein
MIGVLFTQQDLALNVRNLCEFENCTPINLHFYVSYVIRSFSRALRPHLLPYRMSHKHIGNRPWRPIGLWDIKAPTFSRQSAHRWWWGCQPYVPVALYTPGGFLVLISVKGWVGPRAIMQLEGLGQLKNPVTSLGIKPATFQLVG